MQDLATIKTVGSRLTLKHALSHISAHKTEHSYTTTLICNTAQAYTVTCKQTCTVTLTTQNSYSDGGTLLD
jgi:hypothetical protein